MEMEDHHQYGVADLRQLMNGRPHFASIPPPPPPADLFSGHHHHRTLAAAPQPYEMLMMPRGPAVALHSHDHQFHSDHYAAAAAATTAATTAALSCGGGGGLDGEMGCIGVDGGTGRWPRQETLTLLEIRSRLDPKFKEANQKGPLWDEVSRIMSEEHGYQRSGKKCREKFENLYKYYKKTKEGKAGRQDGKHYRFFRQLEALYGDTASIAAAASSAAIPSIPASDTTSHFVATAHRYLHTPTAAAEANQPDALQASLSLSTSSDLDTSSSDDYNDNDSAAEKGKKRRTGGGGRRNWKAKVKEFIDAQMRRLMEKQEAWLEKMLRALEHKEQERISRDEEWRRQEAARLDREHRFWASERAWIKARDAALLEALQKLSGGGGEGTEQNVLNLKQSSPEELMVAPEIQNDGDAQAENAHDGGGDAWAEGEIARLIQLRTAAEARLRQGGYPEEVFWEDIAAEMAGFGHERSGCACKEKWEGINNFIMASSRTKEGCSKKSRKEGYYLRSCGGYEFPAGAGDDSVYRPAEAYCEVDEHGRPEMGAAAAAARGNGNGGGSSPPSNSNGVVVQDGCFRFLMADGGENLWESYGVKLKGEN